MSELLAVMPYSHYEDACNVIREATGKTGKIKSGNFASEARAAIAAGGGNSGPVKYSEGLELGDSTVATGFEVAGIGACTDADIVIPGVYNGTPVVSIDINAFTSNTTITSVVIPASVVKIGYSAFASCSNLKTVTICNPNVEMQPFSNIAGMYYNFNGCTSLTDIYVPWSEGAVEGAPWGAPNATIHYDADVSRYGSEIEDDGINKLAQLVDRSITKITAEDLEGTTKIGGYAFTSCGNLADVEIPDSVTNIEQCAFEHCASIKVIAIPASVKKIGSYAFRYCTALSEVHTPSISAWCQIAFGADTSNPVFYAKKLYVNNELITELEIPDIITSLGTLAFYNCHSITSVKIGRSVTTLNSWCFANCSYLTSVIMPGSISSIYNGAFQNCASLKKIDFSNCTSIPTLANKNAFTGVPDTCIIILPDAFYDEWIARTNWSALTQTYVKKSEYVEG